MFQQLSRIQNPILAPNSHARSAQVEGDLFHQPQSPYHLGENEVCVDLFCGAGGTSQGILEALHESPAFAVNHNPDAIGVHDANHPETIHLESDVFAARPEDHIAPGKSIGLLCASPSCTMFSVAKGGKPLDRNIRDQAWVVANWCEHPNPRYRPRCLIIENVREFLTWAPLTAEDRIDKRFIDKRGLGSTFKEWRDRIISAGYAFEHRIINAAEHGVATKRKRLIMVARRDGLPIRFPEPTHAPRSSELVKSGKLKPFKAIWECLDFKISCNPIFMYPEDAKAVGAKRPLSDKTLKRIAAGLERHVIEAEKPYIIPSEAPQPPISASSQESLGSRISAIVNPMVMPVTHAGAGRYYTANDQFPTLTCARRGELALLSPQCTYLPSAKGTTLSVIPAVTANDSYARNPFAGGNQQTSASYIQADQDQRTSSHAFLITTGYGERKNQSPRVHSVHDPLNTIVACGTKHALVETAFVSARPPAANNNERVFSNQITAIHIGQENFRDAGRSAYDPLSTLTTTTHQSLIATSMIQPLIAAHMAQNNAENVGHPLTEPASTMTTKVCHQSLVTSHLLTLRQNCYGQSLEDPIPTICADGNHHGEVRTSLVKFFAEPVGADTLSGNLIDLPINALGMTEEQRFDAWWIARFLEEYGTKPKDNQNTAHLAGPRPSAVGRPGAILSSVEMRMLVPREAYAASSFPAHYQFERRSDGKPISKTVAMSLCGNAVPPGLAKAVVAANLKPRMSLLQDNDKLSLAA